MIALLFGILLLPLAAADMASHILSNRTIAAFAAGGLLCGILRLGVRQAALGMTIGWSIGLLLWLMRAIGGADAKLYAALGAAVGCADIIRLSAASVIIGGGIGLLKIVWIVIRKHEGWRALSGEAMAFVPCMTLAYWYVIL